MALLKTGKLKTENTMFKSNENQNTQRDSTESKI